MTTKPQSTTETLEPCPFCGGVAVLGMFNIWCARCEAQIRKDVDAAPDDMIKRWNARAPASAAPVVDNEVHCWHCGIVLERTELKPRCDECSADCDDEFCNAFGCAPSAAATAAPVEQSDEDPHPGYDCGGTCVIHCGRFIASPSSSSTSARTAAEEIALLEKPNHSNEFIASHDCDICNAYKQKIAAIIERHYEGAR